VSAPGDDLPLRFGDDGLVPAVVQDATTGDVLMVAFMNAEALAATRETGRAHFWSRGRNRLWRKGETSGHEQVVRGIFVNCEQNSLLLKVDQIGAACHDGYPTCFYRRLEPDGELLEVRKRVFDPAAVYGPGSGDDPLLASTRLLYGAFAYLRDNDLAAVSNTSARLRASADRVSTRVADELRELAGVLDGSHRHTGPVEDALVEATQVLYWLVVAALRGGVSWEALRPDRALRTHDPGIDANAAARLLRAEARRWALAPPPGADHAARCHAAIALVGQACHTAGVSPEEVVNGDLAALRAKTYLAAYFAAAERAAGGRGRGPDRAGS
jgi:phosphoribosyl-AMP cyclohydrolase